MVLDFRSKPIQMYLNVKFSYFVDNCLTVGQYFHIFSLKLFQYISYDKYFQKSLQKGLLK